MVTQWGMSDAVGLVFHAKDNQSAETQAEIDREVSKPMAIASLSFRILSSNLTSSHRILCCQTPNIRRSRASWINRINVPRPYSPHIRLIWI